jgi:hypothetical protein
MYARACTRLCMYARAWSAAPWPNKNVSSTPASIAAEMSPLQAEIPEKREESPPACVTAQ